MRRIFILSLSLLAALIALTSCDDDDTPDCSSVEHVEAMLHWAGHMASDGCGFTLQVGNETYKPTNEEAIPEKYKIDTSTPVEVKLINYHKTAPVYCGFAPSNMNQVKILEIREL